jgi:hypothetical protein
MIKTLDTSCSRLATKVAPRLLKSTAADSVYPGFRLAKAGFGCLAVASIAWEKRFVSPPGF